MVIWAIAKTTLGEAMRKKILNVCLIVAIAMIILSLSFTQLGFKQDMTIVKSLGLFVILLAGFIISLLMSISLIPNEVDRKTIYTILSKPVKRYEFVIGKYLGGLMTLFINTAVMGVVFVGMVALKAYLGQTFGQQVGGVAMTSMPGEVAGAAKSVWHLFDTSLIWGIILIYFQFFLMTSIVMLFSIFMSPTVNFFASASVYVVGSAADVWLSLASNKSTPHLVSKLYTLIYNILPKFSNFNVQNRLIHPHLQGQSLPEYSMLTIIYALGYSFAVLIIAVLLFEKKEV